MIDRLITRYKAKYRSIKYKRLSMIIDVFLEANHFSYKFLQAK